MLVTVEEVVFDGWMGLSICIMGASHSIELALVLGDPWIMISVAPTVFKLLYEGAQGWSGG